MPTNIWADQRQPPEGIGTIRKSDWQPHAAALKHLFLAGDLQRPVPHPFFRRTDVELVWCEYQPGDDGVPHWHEHVDEIEIVLAGRVGYRDIATNELMWFEEGDVLNVPRGLCVERVVRAASRTLAVKLPSRAEKVECRACARECAQRRELFQGR